MGAGGVISSLGTVREDQLFILGRHDSGRLWCGRRLHGLRRRFRRRWNVRARLVEHVGQFVEHGIASQAQLAQDFSDRAHNLGQALGAEDNQRDRKDDYYFEKVQTSMTVRRECRNSMTLPDAEKFRATATCQLIIITEWCVNDA